MHFNLGILDRMRGEFDRALTHFGAALDAVREAGNRRQEAHVLGNLGTFYLEQNQWDEAGAHYDAALVVSRETADAVNEGETYKEALERTLGALAG